MEKKVFEFVKATCENSESVKVKSVYLNFEKGMSVSIESIGDKITIQSPLKHITDMLDDDSFVHFIGNKCFIDNEMISKISEFIRDNNIYEEVITLIDDEDWGASVSDRRIGLNKIGLESQSLRVSGSPCSHVEHLYIINGVQVSKEEFYNKIPD